MTKALIAVVDDDPSIVKSLARLLGWAGYKVATFGSAKEFLDSLATAVPECLVLDVQMPEMGGLEMESRLQERGHQLPVIFITAHYTPQTRTAATRSERMTLLFKPFGNAALLAAVGKALLPTALPTRRSVTTSA